MNTTHTHKKFRAAVVGTMAAPALLFLSAGSAHAFNPQPDPPGFPAPGSQVGFAEESESGHDDPRSQVGFAEESESGHDDPRSQVGLAEESESGLAGPHTLPPLHH